MKLFSEINTIKKKFSEQILFEEKLSKYSWFNIGGPAKVVFKPKSINELSMFLKHIKGYRNIKVLGAGSNTLIRDGGYNGIIIKLGKPFSHLSLFNTNTLIAGSSSFDKNVSNFAYENSLSDLEFLSCIPGTIGGGIRMNSGCYGEDISQILISVQVMDLEGQMRVIYAKDIRFILLNSSDSLENIQKFLQNNLSDDFVNNWKTDEFQDKKKILENNFMLTSENYIEEWIEHLIYE